MNDREQRGILITKLKNQIRRIDDTHYTVNSQSSNKQYDVISTEYGWTCSCPDHRFRHVCCKHIHAVEISLAIRQTVKPKVVLDSVTTDCCMYCKSENIIKRGIRKNKTHSIQIYSCKDCNKRFSINLGFEKMHASPQVITSAMQLYFTGESYRGVQKFLRLQGVNMSHVAVYKWVKKYVSLMEGYLKTITPQVGEKWHADEVWVKINGDMKYLFAMMDNETRFWLAQEVADSKFKHDAKTLLKMGKEAAGKVPSTFVTDGLPAYNNAFRKEYAPKNFLHKPSKHVREIHLRNEKANNNIQERLNGEFRDREKVARGLKKGDSPMIEGSKIYHNFIRPHMGLDGDTPADRAGIAVRGDNKWKTIIENASSRSRSH